MMFPKSSAHRDKKMLQACKGEPCYLRIPGICIGGTETTVPAHSNEQAHGKAMGRKADDRYSVPACFACHAQYDQGRLFTRAAKFSMWRAAYARWEPVRIAKLQTKQNPATAATVPGLSTAHI